MRYEGRDEHDYGRNQDSEKGDGEIIYQMTMQATREMLQQELITRDEYLQFDTKMRQKYAPVFGSIFSDINLK